MVCNSARLAGESIPLSARIVAIADVYDALSTQRVYKDAYSHEHCVEIIRADAGTHFDPRLVEVFLEIHADFASVASEKQDQLSDADGAVTENGPLDSEPGLPTIHQNTAKLDVLLSDVDAALQTPSSQPAVTREQEPVAD